MFPHSSPFLRQTQLFVFLYKKEHGKSPSEMILHLIVSKVFLIPSDILSCQNGGSLHSSLPKCSLRNALYFSPNCSLRSLEPSCKKWLNFASGFPISHKFMAVFPDREQLNETCKTHYQNLWKHEFTSTKFCSQYLSA